MPKTKTLKLPTLRHRGSLIIYEGHDGAHSLGHLFMHYGVAYDPTFGPTDVTPDDAATHNRALDEALLADLDNRGKGSMRGTFYAHHDPAGWAVKTWTGLIVSTDTTEAGRVLTFRRNGMTFRGTLDCAAAAFNFARME